LGAGLTEPESGRKKGKGPAGCDDGRDMWATTGRKKVIRVQTRIGGKRDVKRGKKKPSHWDW